MRTCPRIGVTERRSSFLSLFAFARSARVLAALFIALFAVACGDGDTNVPGGGGGAGGSGGEGGSGGSMMDGGNEGGSGPTIPGDQIGSIVVSPTTASVRAGATTTLTVTIEDLEGNTVEPDQVDLEWTSSDVAVATVNAEGVVTGVGAGTATITVSVVDGPSATATITVTVPEVTSVALTPADPTIGFDTTQQFTLIATYDDDSTADVTEEAEWTSSDEDIATINADGLASAVGAGETTITGSIGGQDASTTLTVSDAQLVAINITPSDWTVPAGTAGPLTATGLYEDGTFQNLSGDVVWASDNEAAVTVDDTGAAVAVAVGTAEISATLGDITGTTTVTVTSSPLVNVVVSAVGGNTAPLGTDDIQFTATAVFLDETTQDVTELATWSSGDEDVLTIDAETGVASAVGVGTATVTASYMGQSRSVSFTVTNKVVTGVIINTDETSVAEGLDLEMTATVTFSDNSTEDRTSSAVWSSSSPDAMVALGVVTGVAANPSVTITATVGAFSDSVEIEVTDAVLLELQIAANGGTTIPVGGNVSFTATGLLSNGDTPDLTSQVTFSSSVPATADFEGATAVLSSEIGGPTGTTVVSASLGDIEAEASITVTVSGVTLTSVTLSQDFSVPVGITGSYVLTALYSDLTTANVTSSATWSSATPGVATVSLGNVTGVSPGTSVITATYIGASDTGTVTVNDATVARVDLFPNSPPGIPLGTDFTFQVQATFTDGDVRDVSAEPGLSFSQTPTRLSFAGSVATGVSVGSTQLTANFGGVSSLSPVTVTVTDEVLESIAITFPSTNIVLNVGENERFVATGTYTAGGVIDLTTQVAWSSTQPTKARVLNSPGNEGLVEALEPGSTLISASLDGIVADAPRQVTVEAAATYDFVRIRRDGSVVTQFSMNRGTTEPLTAEGCDDDGCEPLATGLWEVLDQNFNPISHVTLSNASGSSSNALGLLPTSTLPGGYAQVRVRDGLSSVFATVDVIVIDTEVSELSVTCRPFGQGQYSTAVGCAPIGHLIECRASAVFSDGTTGNVTDGATFSSTTAVLGAFQDELSYTNSTGTTEVVACYGSVCSDDGDATQPSVQVEPMKLTGVTVTPGSFAVNAGEESSYTARGTYTAQSGVGACSGTFNYDVTYLASWTSGNGDIAFLTDAPEPGESAVYGSQDHFSLPTVVTLSAAVNNSLNGDPVGNPVVGISNLTVRDACFNTLSVGVFDFNGTAVNSTTAIPQNTFVELRVVATDSDGGTTLRSPSNSDNTWSGDVTEIDGKWILNVGTEDPGSLSFSTSTATCSGEDISGSVALTASGAQPTGVRIYDFNNIGGGAPANVTITKGGEAEFIAVATYGAYDYVVSAESKSTWSNNPLIEGLVGEDGTGGYTRVYSHSGLSSGETYITASHKSQAAPQAYLQITDAVVTSVVINSVVITNGNQAVPVAGVPAFFPLQFSSTVFYSDGTSSVNPGCVSYAPSSALLQGFSGRNTWTTDDGNNVSNVVNVTATCDGVPSATFPVTVNNGAMAALTFFGGSGSTIAVPLNTTTSLTTFRATFTNLQQFDVTNIIRLGSPSCVDGVCDVAAVSLDGFDPTSGILLTSFDTVGTEFVNFSFPTPVASSSLGVPFTRQLQVDVANDCIAQIDLVERPLTGFPDVDGLGSSPRGASLDVRAVARTTSGVILDVTEDQRGTWSATQDLDDNGIVNVASVDYRQFGSLQAAVGYKDITFTFVGTAGTVCGGQSLSETTIVSSEVWEVSPKTPTDLIVLVAPLGEGGPLHDTDTWQLPLGQFVRLVAHLKYSDGTFDDVTAETTFIDETAGADGAADVQFGCGGSTLDTASCTGYGVVLAYAPGTNMTVGAEYTDITSTLRRDSIDFAIEDCGEPVLEFGPVSDNFDNLPVNQTRGFTLLTEYDDCPSFGQGSGQGPGLGSGTEALSYVSTDFASFAGDFRPEYPGVLAFDDGQGNYSGSNETAGSAIGADIGDVLDGVDALASATYYRVFANTTTPLSINASAPIQIVELYLESLAIKWDDESTAASTFVGPAGERTLIVSAVYTDVDGNTVVLPPPDGLFGNSVPSNAVSFDRISATEFVVRGLLADTLANIDVRTVSLPQIVSNVVTLDVTDNCIANVDVQFSSLGGNALGGGDQDLGIGVPFQIRGVCTDSFGDPITPCDAEFSFTGGAFEDYFGDFATSGDGRVDPSASQGTTSVLTATVSPNAGACGEGVSGSNELTVSSAELVRIALDPTGLASPDEARIRLARGTSREISATGYWSDFSSFSLTLLAEYSSTTESVVTVANDGLGTIYGDEDQEGTSIVRATYIDVISDDAYIQVLDREPVSVTITAVPSLVGNTDPLETAQMPSNGFYLDLDARVAFSSGDPEFWTGSSNPNGDGGRNLIWEIVGSPIGGATLDPSTGRFTTGNAGGTQVIQVTYSAPSVPAGGPDVVVTDTFDFVIRDAGPESLSFTSPRPEFGAPATSIPLGGTSDYDILMVLTGFPNEQYIVTNQVRLGMIDDIGTFETPTGATAATFFADVEEGTTTLTAIHLATNTTGSLEVTVEPRESLGLRCVPVEVTIGEGDKAQLRIVEDFTFGDSIDVTSSPTALFQSGNVGVAALFTTDPFGIITGTGIGTTTVSVSVDGVEGTDCEINVQSVIEN